MNCAEIREEMSAFVDGELTPGQRAAIEQHLAGCADCRRRAAELRRLAAGVAGLPKLEPQPGFLAEVRRKIRVGEEQPSWADALFRPVWLKVPLEALAALVVVGTVAFLIRPPSLEKRTQVALAKLDDRRADAPAEAPVASAPLPVIVQSPSARAMADENITETILVEDADAEAVGRRVEVVAAQLNGRIVRQGRRAGEAQSFQVKLPVSNVLAFRSQFAPADGQLALREHVARGRDQAAGYAYKAAQAQEPAPTQELSGAKAESEVVEATAVIEIRVVPPKR